jgi:acyl-CoA reductase-like NAD-dependent aldehyde dehydrogenase
MKHVDEVGRLETLDAGKPVAESTKIDVPLAAEVFYYYAGAATKLEGSTIPVSGPFFNYTLREPLGVVGLIVPWNFPLLIASRKVAPALAAGNCVVLKPAEETPLTALRLGELALEAGLPPGVLNVVPGFGPTAGAALVAHPGVAGIAFTGETTTGQLIMQNAAKTLKKVSLELGGKSPNIVFDDADLEAAGRGAMTRSSTTRVRSAPPARVFSSRKKCTSRSSKVIDARRSWRRATRSIPRPASAPRCLRPRSTRWASTWRSERRRALASFSAARPRASATARATSGSRPSSTASATT